MHQPLLPDAVADARASLVTGRCLECGHDDVVPRNERDPLLRRLLRLAKPPIVCRACGCGHVFHAFLGGRRAPAPAPAGAHHAP